MTRAKVRVCLDAKDLNKAIKRNHYMPILDDVLPQLMEAKIFSLLDAKDGFLQVRLSERSSITPHSGDQMPVTAGFACHLVYYLPQKSSREG